MLWFVAIAGFRSPFVFLTTPDVNFFFLLVRCLRALGFVVITSGLLFLVILVLFVAFLITRGSFFLGGLEVCAWVGEIGQKAGKPTESMQVRSADLKIVGFNF